MAFQTFQRLGFTSEADVKPWRNLSMIFHEVEARMRLINFHKDYPFLDARVKSRGNRERFAELLIRDGKDITEEMTPSPSEEAWSRLLESLIDDWNFGDIAGFRTHVIFRRFRANSVMDFIDTQVLPAFKDWKERILAPDPGPGIVLRDNGQTRVLHITDLGMLRLILMLLYLII